ncbi:hypothetical protein, partial [Bosea massiliensis]
SSACQPWPPDQPDQSRHAVALRSYTTSRDTTRALAKAVRNPALRQSILSHAKERIARELAGGQAIERRQLRQKVPVQQKISPFPSKSEPSRDSPDRRHPNLTR